LVVLNLFCIIAPVINQKTKTMKEKICLDCFTPLRPITIRTYIKPISFEEFYSNYNNGNHIYCDGKLYFQKTERTCCNN